MICYRASTVSKKQSSFLEKLMTDSNFSLLKAPDLKFSAQSTAESAEFASIVVNVLSKVFPKKCHHNSSIEKSYRNRFFRKTTVIHFYGNLPRRRVSFYQSAFFRKHFSSRNYWNYEHNGSARILLAYRQLILQKEEKRKSRDRSL